VGTVPPVLELDRHDEEEFPPRRPFGEPDGASAPEPDEDDETDVAAAPAPARPAVSRR
jgi:hypothetical protein